MLVQLQVFQRLFCVKGTNPSEYYFSLIAWEALNSHSKLSAGISWEGFTEGECRHALFVLQLHLLLAVLYAEQLLGPPAVMPDSHHSRSWEESLVTYCLISFPHVGLRLSSGCSELFFYFSCTGSQCLQQLPSLDQVPLYFSNLFWPLSLNLQSKLWYVNSCSFAVD